MGDLVIGGRVQERIPGRERLPFVLSPGGCTEGAPSGAAGDSARKTDGDAGGTKPLVAVLVEAADEAPGSAVRAQQWLTALSSPSKYLTRFECSGHHPYPDEPARFATYVADVVLRRNTPGTW